MFFQVSQLLSFRLEKQTSKNVADPTFKNSFFNRKHLVAVSVVSLFIMTETLLKMTPNRVLSRKFCEQLFFSFE